MEKETLYGVAMWDGEIPSRFDKLFNTQKEALEYAKRMAIDEEGDFMVVKITSTYLVCPPEDLPVEVTKLK